MISCMKDGKVWYINNLSDFEGVMDSSVYEALRQYIGDEIGQDIPSKVVNELESRIYDMADEIEDLKEENYELDSNNDDFRDENEKLTKENEAIKEQIEKIKVAAGMAKNLSESLNEIVKGMEDL